MWDTEKAWDNNVFRCCGSNLSDWVTLEPSSLEF